MDLPTARAWMTRQAPLLAVLAGGLGLRLVLAYLVFPDQGLSTDLGLFSSWASALASAGPGAFYAGAAGANYPPGYLYLLWPIGIAGNVLGPILGTSPDRVVLELLKIPAILADLAIAVLLYRAARRWIGPSAGLIAAGLWLFIPVTWYDSALWGQVDAVGALAMLGGILLLVEGWSEPAAALAGFSVLIKPQDAIGLVVVIPVLVRRHLLRPGRDRCRGSAAGWPPPTAGLAACSPTRVPCDSEPRRWPAGWRSCFLCCRSTCCGSLPPRWATSRSSGTWPGW